MRTQKIYLVTIKGDDQTKAFIKLSTLHKILFPDNKYKYFALAARLRRKSNILVGDFLIQSFEV